MLPMLVGGIDFFAVIVLDLLIIIIVLHTHVGINELTFLPN
jgi:hypothetical protein